MTILSSVLLLVLAGCTGDDTGDTSKTEVTDADGDGYTVDEGDCDDGDADIFPGATEVPYDGEDQDCDGVDQDDVDDDGFALADDCDDGDPAINPDADELCDDVDNDCDNEIDEDAVDAETAYTDNDGDGFGDSGEEVAYCGDLPSGTADNGDDCDDDDAATSPDAAEICDGLDNDCDGEADDGLGESTTWYADSDADGAGDPEMSIVSCEQPEGYVTDWSDCDDSDAAINPNADELCDDVDQNCDGDATADAIDGSSWYMDADADSFGDASAEMTACTQPEGYVADNTDCSDSDATSFPGGTETCDGADNDCNGTIDDGFETTVWYADVDADTYGDAASMVDACAQPDGYVADSTDCDDASAEANPGATEICDGLDNDCDAELDEEGDPITWTMDVDGDGYGDDATAVSSCGSPGDGYVMMGGDCDDADATVNPAAAELCDGLDNDCDGTTDEDAAGTDWYADADGDSYGDPAMVLNACAQPDGYVADWSDCDDTNGGTNPAAVETCDGVDNDCDTEVDEAGSSASWYMDADADGYGDGTVMLEQCEQPEGYVDNGDDCDDTDGTLNPGASELCDSIDNNCDGEVDNDATDGTTWYYDGDVDTYGDDATMMISCEMPDGYVMMGGDCDDTDTTANPAGTESCDGADNNCDGVVDEAGAVGELMGYADADADTYGAGDAVSACTLPDGYVENADDCDDTTADANPGATESCDTIDNDCDGDIDEAGALGEMMYYMDADADGYGDDAVSMLACSAADGYVDMGDDCDDSDAAVSPDGIESCNSIDDNCDGSVDEAGALGETTTYADVDGDGYGDAADSSTACTPDAGVDNGDDCDDSSMYSYPGAAELCDGEDNNCDGSITDEAGTASHVSSADVWTDWTSVLAAGTESSPVLTGDVSSYTAKFSDGALYLCDGTWYAKAVFSTSTTNASIIGRNGADVTTLTSGGVATGSVVSVTSATINVEGLTITGGLGSSSGTQGGGVIASKSSSPVASTPNLTLTDCLITDNNTGYGGGVAVLGYGWVSLVDTVVTGNTASTAGGGVWMQNYGKISCMATELGAAGITANTAVYGGGVYLSNSSNGTVDAMGCDFGQDSTGDDNSAYDISINPAASGKKYCYTNATALTDAVACTSGTCTTSTDTTCP